MHLYLYIYIYIYIYRERTAPLHVYLFSSILILVCTWFIKYEPSRNKNEDRTKKQSSCDYTPLVEGLSMRSTTKQIYILYIYIFFLLFETG